MAGRVRLGLAGLGICLGLILAHPAAAGQVAFSAQQQSGSAVFKYRFTDAWRQVWPLSFTLSYSAVEAGYKYWRGFQPEVLTRKVRDALETYAQRYNGKLKIEVVQSGAGFQTRYTVEGLPMKQISAEINRETDRASEAYLAENFLIRVNKELMVDYGRMVQIFAGLLSPIAEALSSVVRGDERQKLMIAMAFIQNIPYDTTPPKRSDFGFATPPAMLWQNRGDCDTKTVALAAILKTMLPGYPMILIVVPEHALMAIALPAARGDRLYRWNGTTYVLLEPVGPALTPIGQVSPHSASALARNDGVIVLPVR